MAVVGFSSSLGATFPSPGETLLLDSLERRFPELFRRGDEEREEELERRERDDDLSENRERLRLPDRLRGERERERPLLGLCAWWS